MSAAEFLDTAAPRQSGSAAAFLEEAPRSGPGSASAFLDPPKPGSFETGTRAREEEPTAEELERASRPATGFRTRGGQIVIADQPEPFRDVWDREVQGEQRAPWTGEGGVLESLPAQLVAGTRSAVAQLRRMLAEENVRQRRDVVELPLSGETRGGALTGRAAPGMIERQAERLAGDRESLAQAERDAALARGDLQAVTPHGMNIAQEAVSSLAQSAPPTLAGVAAGILTRNPSLAMVIAGGGGMTHQAGATYGEAREKGASHRISAMAATIDGILEGVGEALPLGIALKSGSPIMARIINTVAAEAGQEAATQAAQDLNAFATYNPDLTFNEAWHNLKVATLAGAMGGAGYGAAGAIADAGRTPRMVIDVKVSGPTFEESIVAIDRAATVDQAIAAATAMVEGSAPSQPVMGSPAAAVAMPDPAPAAVSTVAPMSADAYLGMPEAGDGAQAGPQGLRKGAETLPMRANDYLDSPDSAVDVAALPASDGDGRRDAPISVTDPAHIEQAGENVNTAPSEAQKESGNYAKAHIRLQGLPITIENPKGSERTGTGPGGQRWSVEMPAAYGYVKRTEGADGDQVDVYIGDVVQSDRVFVVDQIDLQTGRFDEHKALLAFPTEAAALDAYHRGFSDGRGQERAGAVTAMSVEEFKAWLSEGDTTAPLAHRAGMPRDSFAELPSPTGAPRARPRFTRSDDGAPLLKSDRAEWIESERWDQIGDTTYYQSVLHQRDGAPAGLVSYGLKGDEITEIINIRSFQQRGGLGTEVVRGILEHNSPDTEIHVRRIQPEAREFWEKVGAQFFETEEGTDGTITRESFAHAQGNRRAPQAAGGARQATRRQASIPARAEGSRAPQQSGEGPPLVAPRSAAALLEKAAPAAPATVLGTPATQLSDRALEVAARTGSDRVRAAAQAEIDRRAPRGEVAASAVAMMPGAQYTGFIDDSRQAAGTRSTAEPIRREDVLARFLKALDATIIEGRMQGGRRLGYFRPKLETIRTKRSSDLETAAHELAHLIDDRAFNGFGTQKGVPKTRPWSTGPNARTFANELRSVSYDATKVYEGWAEFVRLWMTQPAAARAAAPQFTQWFETFIKQHAYGPAIQQAQEDMLAWFGQDALARARSKIGETSSINRHLDGFWDRFRQSTLDDLHGVYRMERDLTGEVTPRGAYESARLTRGAHAIMDGAIRYGHLVKNDDGSFSFKGKGLEQILKPVSGRLDDFLLYAVGRSARELMAQGREHLFTAGEIKAMEALRTDEFAQAFAEYQAWNSGILDFAEAHGVINPHARSKWKRAEYLPFHRVGTGETQTRVGGAEGNWKGIQKLTGGTDNIRDVLGNIIGNAAMLIEVSLKNDARARIAHLVQSTQGGGRFMERIPPESRMVKIDRDQIREKLREAAGIPRRAGGGQAEVARAIDEIIESMPFLMDFLVSGQTPTGGSIMAVLKDGKPTYYEVIDPILYRAISALSRPTQAPIVRWLSLPKRIGQASITLTPDFAMANIARDTIMGAVMSRSGFLPAIDSIRGLTGRLRSDPAYLEYIANGGGYASYFVDESAFRSHLTRFYSQRGINPRTVIDGPRNLLYFLETVFDAFEVSTRLGEFKRLRAQGVHPRQAAYLGREISTDFAMKGDSRTLSFFYDTVMFLRPAVVSMDRLFRGVAHDPNRGAIAVKTAAIALMSAALFLLNRDREEYKDLEDWDRDSYWHFWVPTPDGDDLHFRYPKIWEVGAIATLAERSVERILDGQPKEYAKDFGRVLKQAFHLNFMPQVLAPIYEQATNKDSFTGRPIEPRGLEDLQPFLRAKPYSSETLRQLGLATKDLPEAMQVNPVRAEAMLRGYLNTWAMYGLMAADAALYSDRMPERRLDQYPVVRRFFQQDPPIHTKHERTFYELLDETRRLRATMRELDRQDQEYPFSAATTERAETAGEYLDAVQRDISAMRAEAEEIRRSDLTPSQKRRQLDALTAERNAMFRDAVREVSPTP